MSDAPRTLPPEALDEWALALRERFGLAADDVPVALILDLARDVANGVARPAAPFSAFARRSSFHVATTTCFCAFTSSSIDPL